MKKIKRVTRFFILSFICLIVGILGIYTYAYFSPAIKLNTANAIHILDRNEILVFQGSDGQKWVSLDDISEYVKIAIVSVEDKRFFNHFGFDFLRIIKSMYLNVVNKDIIGGASTISQQYVKNMYLDFGQTWGRKAEEAFLTINLEMHYTKDEILEGYLNTINFGQGNFGIESASLFYFDKKSSELTLEEAIMLVGIPRSPENYNPISNYDACIRRARIVAESMLNNGHLTEEEYKNLFREKIEIHGKREINNLQTLMYYYDSVISELNNLGSIPKSLIKSGGLRIHTALDLSIQETMENSIIENITDSAVQTAGIVTDPKTGGVLALAGGVDHGKSQFNRVTQARRHVGSTIKPILYYAALKNNMTAASTFLSEATSFVFANNQTYTPTNYANRYGNRNITMAAALAYSENIYAVKTHLFLGPEVLVDTLKLAGLEEEVEPNPSLALGATEINMFDYARAFNTFANYGIYNDLFFIQKVTDVHGNILYERQIRPEPRLNQDSVFILNEIMTSTYNASFLNYNAPTLLNIGPQISRKYAIKSGTTDNDYWLVGYNPDILMIIWSGNDMNAPVDSSYSRKIRNIWADTVEYALKDLENSWYEMPNNIVGLPLNAINGEFDTTTSNSTLFYFKRGSEPFFLDN